MKPGIYVHLPFCAVHCSYCDFPISTRTSLSDSYYRALHQELALRPAVEADTLYFGGGTPSLTPATELQAIKDRFFLLPGTEITLEANPDDIHEKDLEQWSSVGINRLSIGIQTLEEKALRVMRRKHTVEEALRAARLVRDSGFPNISFDLIIGTPEQSVDGFLQGLTRLLDFQPHHLSLYLLEIHERTLLQQLIKAGTMEPMPEEAQVECYRSAISILQNHGFTHYEVSNFAKPGYESQHNLKYWTGAPYYGYGAGACAYLGSMRIKNVAPLPQYIELLEKGQLPVEAQIEEDDNERMRNVIIFGLRKREGIDMYLFEKEFGRTVESLFQAGIQPLVADGFLEVNAGKLRLTLDGILVSNEILANVI